MEPGGGSGHLSEFDVERVCAGLPDGALVELVLAEFESFDPWAVGMLARRLIGSRVKFKVALSARGAAADLTDMFRRAQSQYLAVEADLLLGRGA